MSGESYRSMLERHAREQAAKLAEERMEGLANDRRWREEAKAAEERKQRDAYDQRIAAEAASTHPTVVLNELRATGVTVEADEAGVITISPPGLSPVQRKVLESRRDEIVALLRAAKQIETL